MINRPVPRLLLLLGALALGGEGAAAENAVDRPAMADAMTRMMEAMGFMGSGAQGPSSQLGGGMDEARRWGRSMMEGMSQGLPAGTPGPLEGPWEAAGGGLLLVQGSAYRLYSASGAYVDGSLAITGDRLRFWNRSAGFDTELEYALDQGRLALRDQSGRVYLYRRLVLPGGG